MKKNIGSFLYLLVFCCFIGCSYKYSKNKLLIDAENSLVMDSLFVYDSIIIKNQVDTIKFIKYSNGRPFVMDLVLIDSNFYEIRQIRHIVMIDSILMDTLITLSKKDTSIYYPHEKFTASAWDLQYGRMRYKFIKEDNIYKTVKQSMQDSTYFEILYYDDNFDIFKFTNSWRENKIVYTVRMN